MYRLLNFEVVTLFALLTSASACHETPASPNKSASQASESTTEKPSPAPTGNGIVVTYFHGDRRCSTCRGIQETISKTVEDRFAEQLTKGALSFRDVNYEQPENEHFIKEFDISFATMVIAREKNGKTQKWENYSKVWDYAIDKPGLADYIEKQILSWLASPAEKK